MNAAPSSALLPAESPKPISFWPQEHGAYAQIGLCLLTGLMLKAPSLAGFAFALASVAGFLAHEPILVAVGRRTRRKKQLYGHLARRRAALLIAAAGLFGLLGLLTAKAAIACPLVLLFGLLALTGVFIRLRKERTIPGELSVSAAFATTIWLIARASGDPSTLAPALALAWWLALALSTVSVHAMMKASSQSITSAITLNLLATAGIVALVFSGSWVALAFLPSTLVPIAIFRIPQGPGRFKRIGMSLLYAHLATLFAIPILRLMP